MWPLRVEYSGLPRSSQVKLRSACSTLFELTALLSGASVDIALINAAQKLEVSKRSSLLANFDTFRKSQLPASLAEAGH